MPDKFKGTIWETLFKLIELSIITVLIPWASWVTVSIIQFESWKNIAPRWTPADADKLELKMQKYTAEYLDAKIDKIGVQLDKISKEFQDMSVLLKSHILSEGKKNGSN